MKTKLKKISKILAYVILALIVMLNLSSALTIESFSTSPQEVAPGKAIILNIELKNNLEEDAQEISISLDLKDLPLAPYKSSSEASFDEIKEGKAKEVEFELIAESNAETGTYKIPIDISYKLDNETKIKKSFVSVVVNSEPELRLSYEGSIIKEKTNELTIKIVNSGLSEVKLLSLNIEDVSGLKVLNSKQVYIGDIDSDDFDTAEFNVLVSEKAPSSLSLPVKLSYKDSLNNQKEENINLQIKTYTNEEAIKLGLIKKSNIGMIAFAIIILIILYLVYRRLRKKLNMKKKEVGE